MVQAEELAINDTVTAIIGDTLSVPVVSSVDHPVATSVVAPIVTPVPSPVPTPVETPVDSLLQEVRPEYGMIYNYEKEVVPKAVRIQTDPGISFILGGLFILFLIIALRFRNNVKYAVTMFQNLIETRTRQNVFNDTVRETSLIAMLNIMWCACAGIIGFSFYVTFYGNDTLSMPSRSLGMLLGMALAVVYSLFMWGTYFSVGLIFSDREHTNLWVKGFSASQALMSPAFFLIALLAICQPNMGSGLALTAILVFFLAKLVFIWKGYRIFFSQFSSWVLFLCYLCSVEIVPLILSYRCALMIGNGL